ncbi:hypothetical protein MNR02_08705 [Shinella sp. H4-D48]|uniref:hypothetical protein n=1 Tax=Shinella sp. H4-D48 TaxID=2925841 RepID=UPI001F53A4DE|nr:hypothetical protein [Shinella sp. H4-D48]UNK36593.1 hypothetical protein MNR02_08705 [Shinella sp. H4-D48]
MSGSEIMAVVGFFVMLSGTLWGVWWRIEGRVEKAKVDASTLASSANALAMLARQELAEHKLHVSETYVTKAGMQEQTSQILRSIESVGNRIDAITDRLDRVFEHKVERSVR